MSCPKEGELKGQILFKLGTRDFHAKISRVRASKAAAVFIFSPDGMGVAFMKQWAATGAGKSVKLYTYFTLHDLTLKPIGKAAVGTCRMMHWGTNLDNPRNARFVPGERLPIQAFVGRALILVGGVGSW